MGLDTIIFAVIAVVLLARLWTVLGRRSGEDKDRSPFILPRLAREDEDANFARDETKPSEALNTFRAMRLAPASLAGQLQQIKDLDPAFDEKQFLQNAKQSFMTIVGDFAKGELAQITNLVGPDVLAQFRKAIEARRDGGQMMENKIISVKDVEPRAARVEGTKGIITVRFISEQINTLRDAAGKIIGGDKDKAEEITDVWSFARDTKSVNPGWILVETHA